jgi:spermidine/putrescine transport system ATP-binding protein
MGSEWSMTEMTIDNQPPPALGAHGSSPPGQTVCVELVGVRRAFGDVAAVESFDLVLRDGEFFSLLGPSGCGKTTTLRLIAGFERPDRGQVLIRGVDMSGTPPHRRPTNTVFQSYALFSHLSVFENVAFGLKEKRVRRPEIQRRVDEVLRMVQLDGLGGRNPRQLSGGQQQRVALARAIVNEPAILLLDEPLGALDMKLRRAMQTELKTLQRRVGITFLYVTHDQEEALTMSDRVGVMEAGRLIQVGTPEDVYDRPASDYVAGFVGEANILSGRVREIANSVALIDIGGRIVAGTPSLAIPPTPGTQSSLIIRPERIDVLWEPVSDPGVKLREGTVTLPGRVVESAFVGAVRRFQVLLEGGQIVTAAVDAHKSGTHSGSAADVTLRWDIRHAAILGSERAANRGERET